MEYTRLGRSGLKVSRIALGCMSFGDNTSGFSQWALDEEAAAAVLPAGRRAGHHLLGHRQRIQPRHV